MGNIKDRIDTIRIEDCDISLRCYNILRKLLNLDNINISTKEANIARLASYSLEEIEKIRGCGIVALKEIRTLLSAFGYEYDFRTSSFCFNKKNISKDVLRYMF